MNPLIRAYYGSKLNVAKGLCINCAASGSAMHADSKERKIKIVLPLCGKCKSNRVEFKTKGGTRAAKAIKGRKKLDREMLVSKFEHFIYL